MGGFEQHQFRSIDRPLTNEEQKSIRALSSRASINATSATFLYHYGSFKGDEKKLMTDYYDAMFFVSNWGTRRLMFRIPRKLADGKAIRQYICGTKYGESELRIYDAKDFLIVDFTENKEEGFGWLEEDDYDLEDLIPLREDIINGDYRMLYLAWLKMNQYTDFEDEDEGEDYIEEKSPPVPAQLKSLSSPLKTFADYFEIDVDMISAAASHSPDVQERLPDFNILLSKMTAAEKDDYLFRLLAGETRLDLKLKKHLGNLGSRKPVRPQNTANPSFQDLSQSATAYEKIRLEKERIEREHAYKAKMQKIKKEAEKHWKSVFINLDTKSGNSYKNATQTLKDLQDAAKFFGKEDTFKEKLSDIKVKYGKSRALMDRFTKAGL